MRTPNGNTTMLTITASRKVMPTYFIGEANCIARLSAESFFLILIYSMNLTSATQGNESRCLRLLRAFFSNINMYIR
jgi:hypothetical protein